MFLVNGLVPFAGENTVGADVNDFRDLKNPGGLQDIEGPPDIDLKGHGGLA